MNPWLESDVRYLTREEQQAILRIVVRQFSAWKPVGEFANEIVARLAPKLDTDWVTEYLAWNDRSEYD